MAKLVSVRSELAVLRGLTHKNKKIAGTLHSRIDSSYFYSPESVEIYNSILKHFAETGESPSFRLVVEDPALSEEARSHFRESAAVIQSVYDANKAARILNKYRQTRGLYNLAAHIGDQVKKSKVDLSRLLEEVSSAVSTIHTGKTPADAFEHFGKNNNSNQAVKDMLYGDHTEDVIATGISEFDRESGGFARGSLVTIGASSGGGKSLVANALAMFMAALGYKVLIVPLEMSKREMRARLLANLSGIDVTKILTQKLSEAEKELIYKKYKRWVIKTKKAGGRYTVYKPKEDLTIEEVFAATASYDCDVVIIDYISLLKGVDGDDSWQKLGAAARYAKINAENTNRVNILLCQVSDEGKIRYARAISEHSTNSWIWVMPKEEREKEVGVANIDQPKSRNSRAFRLRLGFRWNCMRVEAVSAEDDLPDIDKSQEKRKQRKNLTSPDV